jgi:putative hydrolase of the HAD superfamily
MQNAWGRDGAGTPRRRSGSRCLRCGPVIRAVLFDFGGVILTSPFVAFNRYEDEAGLPRDTIRRLNAAEPDTNAWARLERGELDEEEFVTEFQREAAAAGFAVDARRVIASLRGELRPEMVEAVRRCGARLLTALLTNNHAPTDGADHEPAVLDVLELFDAVIESSVVGVRKPEIEFYEIACRRLGVEPHECVFLDDLGVNLKPARSMGMTTIKVEDPATALTALEQVVGFPLT